MIVKIFICLSIPLSVAQLAPFTTPQEEIDPQELARHVTSLESLMQKLTSQVQELTNKVDVIMAKQDAVVSFKAYTSHDKTFPKGSIIVFDHIESNIGNGYNTASGVFHAPIAGIYTFTCQIETTASGTSEYFLVNQGVTETVLTIQHEYDSKSMTAVFHIGQGDDVYIKKTYDVNNAPLRGTTWTQFSGHLLRAD